MTENRDNGGDQKIAVGTGVRNLGLLIMMVGLIEWFFELPISVPDPATILLVGGAVWGLGFILTLAGQKKQG